MFHFVAFGLSPVCEGKSRSRVGFQATQPSRIPSSPMPGQATVPYKRLLPNYTLKLSKCSAPSSVKTALRKRSFCRCFRKTSYAYIMHIFKYFVEKVSPNATFSGILLIYKISLMMNRY